MPPAVAAPAVGEKKRFPAAAEARLRLLALFLESLPRLGCEDESSMSEYLNSGAAGVWKRALASDMSWFMAARLIARRNDHATMPLHVKTAKAKKASRLPTAMKTVPSGARDAFMYGAFCVGGTVAGGYEYCPSTFGRPVNRGGPDAVLPVAVMLGADMTTLLADPVAEMEAFGLLDVGAPLCVFEGVEEA
jgi:hypothetical protein